LASRFEDLLQRREVVVYTLLERASGKLWQESGGADQLDLRVEVHNGLVVLGGEPVAVAERCRACRRSDRELAWPLPRHDLELVDRAASRKRPLHQIGRRHAGVAR
jgi:hypothetical protein